MLNTAGHERKHQPPRARSRTIFFQVFTLAGVLLSVCSGCGLPTWGELTGAQPENTGPVNVVPVEAPVVQAPVTPEPPPPPPKPQPEEIIARFQTLKSHQINDETLNELANLESGLEAIQELDLRGSPLTPMGFEKLPKLTHLAKIDIRGTPFRDEQLAPLGQVSSLRELSIDGSNLTPASVAAIQALTGLKVFEAENTNLPPLTWQEFFMSHPELEVVRINHCNISDPLMTAVGKLSNLQELRIGFSPVSDIGIAALGELENLHTLILTNCPIRGHGLRPSNNSRAFRKLTHLSLLNAPLDEKGARAIATMKDLQILWIGGMPTMLDAHFQLIVRPLDKLEFLSCSRNTSLTGQAFLALAGKDHLKEVRFDECPMINDIALKHLAKCKSLSMIDLTGTACTLPAVLNLKEALPHLQVVGLQ